MVRLLPGVAARLYKKSGVAESILHSGPQSRDKAGRDRHWPMRDLLLTATLRRGRHHEAGVGTIALDVFDFESSDLADSRARQRRDLNEQSEFWAIPISLIDDGANVHIRQDHVSRFLGTRNGGQSI